MVSPKGAVIGAAHEALVKRFPGPKQSFDAAFFRAVKSLPQNRSTTTGLNLGQLVADHEVAARAQDASKAQVSYPRGNPLGELRPPPAIAPDVLPQSPGVTPFVLLGPTQYTTPGPLPRNGPEYAAFSNQAEILANANSTARTVDPTLIANFWSDGAATATPTGHWNEIAESVAMSPLDSLLKDVKIFATLNFVLADAAIPCESVKDTDGFRRPILAIDQVANEAGMSRIHGGIHEGFDNTDELALGEKVGRYVIHHAFRGHLPH